jgi:hypothetical protein
MYACSSTLTVRCFLSGPVPDYVKEMVSHPPKVRGRGQSNEDYDDGYENNNRSNGRQGGARNRQQDAGRGGGRRGVAGSGNEDDYLDDEEPQGSRRPPRGVGGRANQRGGYGDEGRGGGGDIEGSQRRRRSVSPSPPPMEIEAPRRRGVDGQPRGLAGRGGRAGADYDDDEYDNSRRGGGRGGGGRGGGGFEPPAGNGRGATAVDSDDDESDRNREYGSPRRQPQHGGRRPVLAAPVAQQEYDELSNLCDKLLTQQEDLQREIRQQAKVIKVMPLIQ